MSHRYVSGVLRDDHFISARSPAPRFWSIAARIISAIKRSCEVISEMFHILNCGFWYQVSYDHRSYERTLSNCIQKPEVRTSTGFQPVTSRFRCDALTNWAVATDVGSWSFVTQKWPALNRPFQFTLLKSCSIRNGFQLYFITGYMAYGCSEKPFYVAGLGRCCLFSTR